jgi:hypothetical protein
VAPRAGNRRQKTDLLPVTTTTANALLEISSKQESASDRETANAVTLYASRKEASCIKKCQVTVFDCIPQSIAPLRKGMRPEAHLDNLNRGGIMMLLLSYRFGNYQ